MENILLRRAEMKEQGMPEKDIDKLFYQEGYSNIFSHPMKFLATVPFNLVRLNNPPNQEGVSTVHFLAERENISPSFRILANVFIRFVWLSFLIIAILGLSRYLKNNVSNWKIWGPVALLILYVNAMHAFFVHAEPRFILSAFPFYIIFFVFGVGVLYSKMKSYHVRTI